MYGLFGSGEFLSWADPVDRLLVESAGGTGRVLVLPTASAPEGDPTFWRWGAMGREHYRSLGMTPEVVALKTREDAQRADLVAMVAGASLIFFSGGNPAYLAATLQGTEFWAAVEKEVAGGCSLAGSSAGICFLGLVTFDPQAVLTAAPGPGLWVPALGYFNAVFGPHWDAMERWMRGAHALTLSAVPEGGAFVGVDENTAVLGDGFHWRVQGAGTATVRSPEAEAVTVLPSGASFDLDLSRRL